MEELFRVFQKKDPLSLDSMEPLDSYYLSGASPDIERGKEILAQGKVGCIVLAGGQGTRLGWLGPKGTFPLLEGPCQTLFQLLGERRRIASTLYNRLLPLAIMTSPLNYEETRYHLEMQGDMPDLFIQDMAPLLEEQGQFSGIEGPNGNGEVLHRFYRSGLWEKWKKMGVEYLHVIPIDNPLADPFDPNLCGFHRGDVTLKGILRENAEEQLGLVGRFQKRLKVIEYFEFPHEEREACQGNCLKWQIAHISLFCFSMHFVEQVARTALPWHFAKKEIEGRLLYKPEHFIFDLLAEAKEADVLVYPRKETYAPLKNAHGKNSPTTVRAALLQALSHGNLCTNREAPLPK